MFDVWKQKLKNNNFLVKKKNRKNTAVQKVKNKYELKKKSQNEKSASSNPI